MAVTTYTPAATDALFNTFAGVPFDDPQAYASANNKRIDAKYFLKPIQDEILNLILVAQKSGGAVLVTNSSGSTIVAGPVRVVGYASGRFLIDLADADGALPASLLLLASLANGANGVAYAAGEFTSALDCSGATIGDPVYLSDSGGLTLTAPGGTDKIVQEVGRVKTAANPGVIAGLVQSPIKFGTSCLQGYAVNSQLIAPNAVTTSKLASGVLQAGKNRIINGAFRYWQRGTSGTSGFVADRFLTELSGSTAAISRQAFTAGQTNVPGEPEYFHRVAVTSVAGASNFAQTETRLEDVRQYAGRTMTLSFWGKADSSRNIAVEGIQIFGTGGSAAVTAIRVAKCALTTSWQKFSITMNVPSIAGKTVGANSYFCIGWWWDAGSAFDARTNSLGQQSGTFDIAMVQLEPGSVATEFDQLSLDPAVELMRCQRYCYVMRAGSAYAYRAFSTVGIANSASTVILMGVPLPVRMRTTPAIEATAGTFAVSNGVEVNCNAPTIGSGYSNENIAMLSVTGTTVTSGTGYALVARNDQTAAIILGAEL